MRWRFVITVTKSNIIANGVTTTQLPTAVKKYFKNILQKYEKFILESSWSSLLLITENMWVY